MIQNRIVAAVIWIRLEQLVEQADCVIVEIVIESLDISRKLLRFSGFEFEITKPSHRLGA